MKADVALRLGIEHMELNEKIEKLENFIETNMFESLTEENQFLLVSQLNAMREYEHILARRMKINGIRVE